MPRLLPEFLEPEKLVWKDFARSLCGRGAQCLQNYPRVGSRIVDLLDVRSGSCSPRIQTIDSFSRCTQARSRLLRSLCSITHRSSGRAGLWLPQVLTWRSLKQGSPQWGIFDLRLITWIKVPWRLLPQQSPSNGRFSHCATFRGPSAPLPGHTGSGPTQPDISGGLHFRVVSIQW